MTAPDSHAKRSCCGHSNATNDLDGSAFHQNAESVKQAKLETQQDLLSALVKIPGGIFDMGTRKSTFPDDLDSPRRKVKVDPFLLSPTAVTNQEYAAFVEDTGYQTVADVMGWSFVFHLLLKQPQDWPESPPDVPWWRKVDGATWSAPEGPGSTWRGREDYPVTQIAWYDALAYANWAGLRLPREAEWERAARGGLVNKKFPWGNRLVPETGFAMNTWQGDFPYSNSADDGFVGTAPVRTYEPNGYELYNMTGNVWEWVQDYYGERVTPGRLPENNPTGPERGFQRIQRGGSFLCHESYCDRYQVHSRTRNDPDSSASNCGFRVASELS